MAATATPVYITLAGRQRTVKVATPADATALAELLQTIEDDATRDGGG